MGQVIRLPTRASAIVARTATHHLAPWLGEWDVDDWGRDAAVASVAVRIARLRWRITIGGLEHVPAEATKPEIVRSKQVMAPGPSALVVVNTRRFALTPWIVALSLGDEIGRPVRFVGRSDTVPFGPLARRLGGLLARPDEVAGALSDGQVCVLGADGVLNPRAVGAIDDRLVGAAVRAGAPVIPCAVAISMPSRSARIELSEPIPPPRRRRGPLAELELTGLVGDRIGVMLEEFGGARTGTPLDWLGLSGMGTD